MIYEFATRIKKLNSGKEILIPVVREKRNKFWRWENDWQRIVYIEGRYITLELPWESELTAEQCEEHKIGYWNKLVADKAENVQMLDLKNLEEKVL